MCVKEIIDWNPPLESHLTSKTEGTSQKRGRKKGDGAKDGDGWCGMMSSGYDTAIAHMDSQQLWSPSQTQASLKSPHGLQMVFQGSPIAVKLLAVGGCWG